MEQVVSMGTRPALVTIIHGYRQTLYVKLSIARAILCLLFWTCALDVKGKSGLLSKGIMCGPYGDGKRSCAVSASSVLTGPSQRDRPQSPL
jgi:hypothetical protein